MLNDILALAAGFPKWYNVLDGESLRIIPGWSLFYDECRLCCEPVLKDWNWQQVHRRHHIMTGDIARKKEV